MISCIDGPPELDPLAFDPLMLLFFGCLELVLTLPAELLASLSALYTLRPPPTLPSPLELLLPQDKDIFCSSSGSTVGFAAEFRPFFAEVVQSFIDNIPSRFFNA